MIQLNAAEGIHRIEHANVNFYLVEGDSGVTLVDAGLPTSWKYLEQALDQIGRSLTDLKALVLTHGHFDHIGLAQRLHQDAGVPVYVHDNDVPLLRHPRQYGRARPLSWYLATQLQALPNVARFVVNRAWWPTPVTEVERIRQPSLQVPGNPQVLFTPGHTLGHCALHFPERDVVIAGDAVVTFNPYTDSAHPQLVSAGATADPERAMESLAVIEATQVSTVLTGHGPPWRDGAQRLVQLAREHGYS